MISLQRLTVKDAYHLDLIPSLIVGPDEDFSEVVQRFASRPVTRGIFVADEERHLLGVSPGPTCWTGPGLSWGPCCRRPFPTGIRRCAWPVCCTRPPPAR